MGEDCGMCGKEERMENALSLRKQRQIIGDGDEGRGAMMMEKVATWVAMARRKHEWPRDADELWQAMMVLEREVHEFEEAVRGFKTGDLREEEVVSELLDVITVAMRILGGEHIRDKVEKSAHLELVRLIKPTEPGEKERMHLKRAEMPIESKNGKK